MLYLIYRRYTQTAESYNFFPEDLSLFLTISKISVQEQFIAALESNSILKKHTLFNTILKMNVIYFPR